ncbi:FHA domain-containing protein [Corynebacterium sp. 13CS0277]|uniref:FHA domain-containing protein FhaB/FipA n=1 Tax=Corynebacterium sp. 13CS0277 TaxID=2071994 RepID=UPI000D03718E|nr:FHA domain-containing protein [Corynebacterium sp. 13CS0277]PRQ10442.1 FHA domain-containing protein [Corynebacterium sp. 13CS0277]
MVLLIFRIGLLVLLWLFVLLALRALRRDTQAAASVRDLRSHGAPAKPARATKGQARRVEVVDGPAQGSYLDLGGLHEVTLGRSSQCTFPLSDDYASARHARLFQRGNDWVVEDLDSRNGTFVDGFRIDQAEVVQPGTDIKIGRTTVRLAA